MKKKNKTKMKTKKNKTKMKTKKNKTKMKTKKNKTKMKTKNTKLNLKKNKINFNNINSKLAIDCGRVICQTDTDINKTKKLKGGGIELAKKIVTYKITDECINVIKKLVSLFKPENTYILSKCGLLVQQATVVMFGRCNFYKRTGILPSNVIFCTERSGGNLKDLTFINLLKPKNNWLGVNRKDDKSMCGFSKYKHNGAIFASKPVGKGIIAKYFKLTHLIDDREECLKSFFSEGYLNKNSNKSNSNIKGGLIHFGLKAKKPKKKNKPIWLNKAVKIWHVCREWKDVLKIFKNHIDN